MGNEKLHISSAMEDYLETINALIDESGVARVRDIASRLDVKSPTVNAAVKNLAAMGMVMHERYGYITLTPLGRKEAARVQRTHDILFRFLTEVLCIDKVTAQHEACSIEHAVSPKTQKRLTQFLEFLDETCSEGKPKLFNNFESISKPASFRNVPAKGEKILGRKLEKRTKVARAKRG
jgi:DtxR family Mn-dependent transcriptional regulator